MTDKVGMALVAGAVAIVAAVCLAVVAYNLQTRRIQAEIDKAAFQAGLCQMQPTGAVMGWPYYRWDKCAH